MYQSAPGDVPVCTWRATTCAPLLSLGFVSLKTVDSTIFPEPGPGGGGCFKLRAIQAHPVSWATKPTGFAPHLVLVVEVVPVIQVVFGRVLDDVADPAVESIPYVFGVGVARLLFTGLRHLSIETLLFLGVLVLALSDRGLVCVVWVAPSLTMYRSCRLRRVTLHLRAS